MQLNLRNLSTLKTTFSNLKRLLFHKAELNIIMFPSRDGETGGGEARETRHQSQSEAYRRVFSVSKEAVIGELGAPFVCWTFFPFILE